MLGLEAGGNGSATVVAKSQRRVTKEQQNMAAEHMACALVSCATREDYNDMCHTRTGKGCKLVRWEQGFGHGGESGWRRSKVGRPRAGTALRKRKGGAGV